MVKRYWLFAFFALLTAGFVYQSLLFRAEPLARDDLLLISPLEGVHSPAAYFSAWKSARVIDLAPIRDLSLLLDLKISQLAGVPVFHVTNLVLWFLFLGFSVSVFRLAVPSGVPLWPICLVLCCHPVYVVSVAWISGRRHLLAAVLALLATRLLLGSTGLRKARSGILLAYCASVLSNPIFITWPIWALLWKGSREGWKKAFKFLWLPVLMMAGLGIANLWYYSSLYLLASGGISKYSPAEDSGFGVMVLALGRACYNLLLPLAISPVDYFPGAPENFLGLILLPVLIFLFWKLAASRDSVSWGIFALLPLFTVNLRSTRVFLSDTYLLLPSIGLWILIGCAWSRSKAMLWPTPIKWMTKAFALIFAVAGLWVGHLNAKSFFSLPELFSRAFSIEATPQVSLVHASQLFEEGKYREAAEIAYGLGSKVALADELYARAVSADPALAVGQKIQALKQWPSPSPVYNYYLSSLFAQAGRFRDASAVLAPYLTQLTSFGDLAPAVAADACWFLEQSGGSRENLRTLLLSQLPLAEQKVHFEKRLRELSERSRGKSP